MFRIWPRCAVDRHPRLFVLTGAGVSTDSGIPDYRDTDGEWKRSPPMTLQTFMGGEYARARYWARSMVGWRRFGQVQPNASHRALAQLQQRGRVSILVTQNVDGLHEAAGSRDVVDLHGRLDQVRCMNCDWRGHRDAWQQTLHQRNPAGSPSRPTTRPMAMPTWMAWISLRSRCRPVRSAAASSSPTWCSSAKPCRASGSTAPTPA